MSPVKATDIRMIRVATVLHGTAVLEIDARITISLVVVASVAMALTVTTLPAITPGLKAVDETEKSSIISAKSRAIKTSTSGLIVRILGVLLSSLSISSTETKIPLTTVGRITIKIIPVLGAGEVTLTFVSLTGPSNAISSLRTVEDLLDVDVMLHVEVVLTVGAIGLDVVDPSTAEGWVVTVTLSVLASRARVSPDILRILLRQLTTVLPAIGVVSTDVDVLTKSRIARG